MSTTALGDIGNRRNPRRSGPKPDYAEDHAPQEVLANENEGDGVYIQDDVESDESTNPADDENGLSDEDDSEKDETRGRSQRFRKGKKQDDETEEAHQRRTSSRSTKFKSSMKEPSGDSIRDLMQGESMLMPASKEQAKTVDSKIKSPASRHSSRRKRVQTEVLVSEEEEDAAASDGASFATGSEQSDDEDGGEDEDELKIERIIASRTEPRRVWRDVCKGMNTSEINSGSRWFQDNNNSNNDGGEGDDTFEERFLVKWAGLSFLHCSWETEKDLVDQIEGAKTYLRTFFKKSVNGFLYSVDERCDGDYFDPAFVQIDRILGEILPDGYEKSKNPDKDPVKEYGIILDKSNEDFETGTGRQFLVKWGNSPYSDVGYEFEQDLIACEVDYLDHVESFHTRSEKPSKSAARQLAAAGDEERRRSYLIFGDNVKDKERDQKVAAFQKELAENVYPNGGQLRDYQAEGVSFLVSNYMNGRCSILADEMGLGKTLQTCAFVNVVATRYKRRGPYLVVAPLSTLEHWKREFTTWTNLNTIVYHGSALDRENIREFEVAYEVDRPKSGVAFNQNYLKRCMPKSKTKFERLWMAQVIITTPEIMVASDAMELSAIEWDVLVVDEAHRLKNHNSKMARVLRDHRFTFNHSLLLTGTPIQNNMTELWTLMNFIDADTFGSHEAFLEQYGDIKSKERIDQLHESIRPYILRRLKEDVEKSVPPKEETLIEVELTVVQKQYYRALYEKNVQFLHRNKKKALDGPSINNLAMQLRKCCNHPFLLRGVEEEMRSRGDTQDEGNFLVKSSGKLVLLDKLLPRLQEKGHRVLMFSQFKIMLDILEDYLSARGWNTERIDGSITGRRRQMAIDRFQAPASEEKASPFIMLLSTRAGGVGINLTAADTCIIFDSDWNPQNDLQAQARCHRIGQTKSVKVYRLLTRKTYEMQMFHMSSLKMGLDQAVLQGFESGSSGEGAMSKEEVEKLLRHGAYDIFSEDKAGTAEAESNAFVEQDIDSILERRSRTVIHENTGSKSSAAGGTFSKASFKAPNTPDGRKANAVENVDVDDPDFWKKMVGEGQEEDPSIDLTGKKRKRKEQNYSEQAYDRSIALEIEQDESSASVASDDLSSSDEFDLDEFEMETLTEDGAEGSVRPTVLKHPKEPKKWGRKESVGFLRPDSERLFKGLQMYGYGNISWESFREKMGLDKYAAEEVKRMAWSMVLITLCEAAAEGAKKKSDRQVAKGHAPSEDVAAVGGVLASVSEPVNPTKQAEEEQRVLFESFAKVWSAHVAWCKRALADGFDYARYNRPRPKAKLDAAMQNQSSGESATGSLHAKFAQNLWPALKSRGWRSQEVQTTRGTQIQYVFDDHKFSSPRAVIEAVESIHKELSNAVAALKEIVQSERENQRREAAVPIVQNFGYRQVEQLLHQYAPLQLLVDRTKYKKMSLGRRVLLNCNALFNAHNIVNVLQATGAGDVVDKIADRLDLSKRSVLPVPCWTSKQDAVLVYAISKHGWIEHDQCSRAMTEDMSIRWGAPFDETSDVVNPKEFRESAFRAARFLNAEHAMIETLKEFKIAPLINSYGLEDNSKNAQGEPFAVDDEKIKQRLESSVTVDLPTKQELVRRAKAILGRPPVWKVEQGNSATDENGHPRLDLAKPSNALLAEILRTIIKVSFTNSAKRKQLGEKLFSYGLEEARYRIDDLSRFGNQGQDNTIEIAEMKKVVDRIELAHRHIVRQQVQAKNVLRAVLGMPLSAIKHDGDAVFPSEARTKLNVVNGKGLKSSGAKQDEAVKEKDSEATSGESAVNVAMKRATQKVIEEGNCVELTGIEVLLISVAASQGLPVWTKEWLDMVVARESLVPENQGPGYQYAIAWYTMGHVVEAAAHAWFSTAEKKLENKKSWFARYHANASPDTEPRRSAEKKIACLELDVKRKRVCLGVAHDYNKHPLKLAKKCVMLLDKIRCNLGEIETKREVAGRISENGLGQGVLAWMQKEVARWANSLGLVDFTGSSINLTAVDFAAEDDQEAIFSITALMEREDCRAVFAQIAQQSRVRSIFLGHRAQAVNSLVERAVNRCKSMENSWVDLPVGWGKADERLLAALLEYGYSGIQDALRGFNVEVDNEDSVELDLSKPSVQYRANQLTRELHEAIEREEIMSLLRQRTKELEKVGGTDADQSQTLSVQAGIESYFKTTPDPTVSEDSDDVVIVMEKPSAELTSVPESGAQRSKRKEVVTELIDLTDASPEKKLKATEA